MYFDPIAMIVALPAVLLMLWAQAKVKGNFERGMQVPARLTGVAAARHILDSAGLQHVGIEQTPGMLSDHYDPSAKVLRLSPPVYGSRTAAAVGIAAHEAGHALQDATNYLPLVVRNAAVPAARFGPTLFFILFTAGAVLGSPALMKFGVIAFASLAFFQLVNLPVEFDASARAKRLLTEMQIVDASGESAVNAVLNSAAWTYVAATLQTVLQVGYYALRMFGGSRSD